MPRPCKRRAIAGEPQVGYFKPVGVPMRHLGTVNLSLDELEALRLCYLEGLYQEQAAEKMEISRQTIGRILTDAINKITGALLEGKAIRIEGGNVVVKRKFTCSDCGHDWEVPHGLGRPLQCPSCGSRLIQRAADDRGFGRRGHQARQEEGRGWGNRCRRRQTRQNTGRRGEER
jgi:predicted DNA-binding protein (UPF0251 family)